MNEDRLGYFPGSNEPLPDAPPVAKKRPLPVEGWDDKPVIKIIGGQPHEYFLIGHVVKALGRPHVTVRHWIREGHIPIAPYRMPPKNGIQGRRLWRREHIEVLIRLAYQHGLLDAVRVDWSKHSTFKAEVEAAWKALDLT